MGQKSQPVTPPLRVLVMSSYIPRACGIATYAEDVIHAVELHGARCQVLAMERPGEVFAPDGRVIGTVREDDPQSYRQAAAFVNGLNVDVLSLQHEFGLYGGDRADYLLRFLEAVDLPVVVTFHTIQRIPDSPATREIQRAIARRAQAIVVMNGLATEILASVYDVDAGKITVIPHGAPVPSHTRGDGIKRTLGMEGEEVLSTFGLIVPSKGLEYMVRAMPDIVSERPQAVYYILGQTHPDVRMQQGETYRHMLQELAVDLDVEDHVRFVDRYLGKDEVIDYLLATDTFVTPYVNLDQITSGALAYAIGSGCPIVATPYLHVQALQADGRCVLVVPPRDAEQLARGVLEILNDPIRKARMEQANWEYGRTFRWPRVGADYLRIFRAACR